MNSIGSPIGLGWNLATQLICGPLVGIGIGLFIDWRYNTKPWGIAIGCVIGFIAGIKNCLHDIKKNEKLEQEKLSEQNSEQNDDETS